MEQRMTCITQGLDARQVMATWQRNIAAEAMRPDLADDPVLALKFRALVAADGGNQGDGEVRPVADRADKLRGGIVEP